MRALLPACGGPPVARCSGPAVLNCSCMPVPLLSAFFRTSNAPAQVGAPFVVRLLQLVTQMPTPPSAYALHGLTRCIL